MSLRKKIIAETLTILAEDTKFIRLATVATFMHALVFTFWMVWRAVTLIGSDTMLSYADLLWIGSLWRDDLTWSMIVPALIIGLCIAFWYAILHPVWEAAMIIYLDEDRQQWTLSLTKWFSKYFPMVELNGALGLFSMVTVIYRAFRLQAEWILDSFFWYAFIIMRWIITLFTMVFFSYSKVLVSIEWMSFFESLKESTKLATQHFGITLQFTVITFLLSIRFIINIAIILGVPLLLIYIGTLLGIDQVERLQYVFIFGIIWLLFLIIYIEWIIEAFFITCRWKVYKHIKTDEQELSNSRNIE